MSNIGVKRLNMVLSALGEQLEAAGERAHRVVIGGSGLIAIISGCRPASEAG